MEFNNLKTYCITSENLNHLENLNLKIIVGGAYNKKEKFPKNWLQDDLNNNISAKNKNFGSLTSIYWIWKNELKKYNDNTWIGISHYRRFWLKEKHDEIISLQNLNENLLDSILDQNLNFESFVASSLNLTGYKPMKLLKKASKNILREPSILINKNKHNIKLHFDMFHLYKGLEKATEVMNQKFRYDFLNYINTQTELFSPFSIFILKKNKFNELCEATFEWIHNCENIFNVNELRGHGQTRLFDYLAERFFSFWIKNNTNYKVCPFVFFDPKTNGSSIIQ